MAGRSRVGGLAANAVRHDQVDVPGVVQFEYAIHQIVVSAAVPIEGVGVDSNRTLTGIERSVHGSVGSDGFIG